jgi:hypothetical protein
MVEMMQHEEKLLAQLPEQLLRFSPSSLELH